MPNYIVRLLLFCVLVSLFSSFHLLALFLSGLSLFSVEYNTTGGGGAGWGGTEWDRRGRQQQRENDQEGWGQRVRMLFFFVLISLL